jgi:hypothetical protein
MRLAGIPESFDPKKFSPRNFKSCVVRISVDLRWTSFLLSAFFITAAEAAPGDKIDRPRKPTPRCAIW